MQGGRKIDELQVCTNKLNPLLIFFLKELVNVFFPCFFWVKARLVPIF